MTTSGFTQFSFVKSCAKLLQMPADQGREVAFIGRSNAGKSSALNTISGINKLAKTSKTPGRTQLINVFAAPDDLEHRLIDLPGYGYAKVPESMRLFWAQTLPKYFADRQSLKALMLIMDIRHPLKPNDMQMLAYLNARGIPAHILLTKADKLSKAQRNEQCFFVEETLKNYNHVTMQVFSSTSKLGLSEARAMLSHHLYREV